jgi:TfoX/Sxy family transcriptional regulator of competence genes
MATQQSTVDTIIAHIQGPAAVRARKMFGEYALYCDEKVIGLICDDTLFIKPTSVVPSFIDTPEYAPAYPGSKDYILVPESLWQDGTWLTDFVLQTAAALPVPKPKKKRK